MPNCSIEQINEGDLPQVAAYLAEHNSAATAPIPPSDPQQLVDRIHQTLRWRLIDNPNRLADDNFGLCLRGDTDQLLGTLLTFPQRFRLEGKRLTGFTAANFFVDPSCRIHAYFMFRRFLQGAEADFYFATTISASAARLWIKLGGVPVAHSNREFIFPLNVEAILDTVAKRHDWGAFVQPVLKRVGRATTRIVCSWNRTFKWKRHIGRLTVQECHDWEKLAALVSLHDQASLLTGERSPDYLRWRYASQQTGVQNRVFLFRDSQGREGWFVLQLAASRGESCLMTANIADLVWARETVDVEPVLIEAVEQSRGEADIIRVKGRARLSGAPRNVGFWTRRFQGPDAYVIGSGDDETALADRADFVLADGDTR